MYKAFRQNSIKFAPLAVLPLRAGDMAPVGEVAPAVRGNSAVDFTLYMTIADSSDFRRQTISIRSIVSLSTVSSQRQRTTNTIQNIL